MSFSFSSCLPFHSGISVCFPFISSIYHAMLASEFHSTLSERYLLPQKYSWEKSAGATIKSNQYRITSDFQQAASFFSHHFFSPFLQLTKHQYLLDQYGEIHFTLEFMHVFSKNPSAESNSHLNDNEQLHS